MRDNKEQCGGLYFIRKINKNEIYLIFCLNDLGKFFQKDKYG